MRRVVLAFVVVSLASLAAVVAQPPALPVIPPAVPATEPVPPAPPRTLAAVPAPVTPAATAETPLSQFEPLAAFPLVTQNSVRGVLLGANWMTRMSQPQGRFLYGYTPALRQSVLGDHDLRQARGALALAQAARFTGDEKQAAVAAQCILALLAATRVDPADPTCRVPLQPSAVCNRVGFAAVLALAIYELPAADARLVAEAERLCEFLRRQCRADGSVRCADGTAGTPDRSDPSGDREYPGMALHAIMAGNRIRPAGWKAEVVKNGAAHYRAAFKANPHPLLAATLTPACAELYLQTKLPEAADAAFALTDRLCALQIPATDPRTPQWAGGFRAVVNGQPADLPPGPETGLYVQGLASACRLTRHVPDLDRHARYKAAVTEAAHFLCGLQYLEANTRHFENAYRANMLIGGFHLSPADGDLRIDATGTAVTGLLGLLASGAERN